MNAVISANEKAIGIDELLQRQAEARVIEPLRLERETLLRRIKQGGWSGEFLADAFLSAYGHTPFNHSLGRFVNLDAEGFRLFHEIVHMRSVPGWSDDMLFSIACEIGRIVEAK